jgi:hypothetical protein
MMPVASGTTVTECPTTRFLTATGRAGHPGDDRPRIDISGDDRTCADDGPVAYHDARGDNDGSAESGS